MPVAPVKSLENWIWAAACSIRGAKDAPKYKDYILPLIFTKRLCDVFDDEINRIAKEVGSRRKAFQLAQMDWKKAGPGKAMVRFFLPILPEDPGEPVWSVIRKLSDRIGEQLTSHLRAIAKENPLLEGIIDRIDFNATTHGQRDIDDDRLSNLIEAISTKRLGLEDVEADIIGKSYEYLIRKFAEGGGQSAGEFYTPPEVGEIMAKALQPEPGMEAYDPTCGSLGLLIKMQIAMEEKRRADIPVRQSNMEEKRRADIPVRQSKNNVGLDGGEAGMAKQNRLLDADGGGGLENPLSFDVDGGLENPPSVDGSGGSETSSVAPLKLYGQEYIADTLIQWTEEEKFSRIVDHAELKKNDYNISPSRYIHTGEAETYRPIPEIVAELAVIEREARETDRALQKILKQLSI